MKSAIVVIGPAGKGKSYIINRLTKKHECKCEDCSFKDGTKELQTVVYNNELDFIDTPGIKSDNAMTGGYTGKLMKKLKNYQKFMFLIVIDDRRQSHMKQLMATVSHCGTDFLVIVNSFNEDNFIGTMASADIEIFNTNYGRNKVFDCGEKTGDELINHCIIECKTRLKDVSTSVANQPQGEVRANKRRQYPFKDCSKKTLKEKIDKILNEDLDKETFKWDAYRGDPLYKDGICEAVGKLINPADRMEICQALVNKEKQAQFMEQCYRGITEKWQQKWQGNLSNQDVGEETMRHNVANLLEAMVYKYYTKPAFKQLVFEDWVKKYQAENNNNNV